MDDELRRGLIERYREGPGVVEAAVAGLDEDGLDRRPSDGGWTAREVVHHLADSEMMSAMRLRLLLAEDSPVIHGYDEEEFARRLHYGSRPVQPSLEAVRAARETTSSLLERLADEDWARTGTHTESGPYSVQTWLEIYARHAHDHAAQIRRAAGIPDPS
ncbi:MAG TPA: DinB family protein [Actinomycetota bacterium]